MKKNKQTQQTKFFHGKKKKSEYEFICLKKVKHIIKTLKIYEKKGKEVFYNIELKISFLLCEIILHFNDFSDFKK